VSKEESSLYREVTVSVILNESNVCTCGLFRSPIQTTRISLDSSKTLDKEATVRSVSNKLVQFTWYNTFSKNSTVNFNAICDWVPAWQTSHARARWWQMWD
jgi:hypothetical protein